jgi:type IV pilus assembly protein PilW
MNSYSSRKQQGLSLIELMIAVSLGAFILLAVSQIYVSNLQSNSLQKAFSRVQESGRIGVELLVRKIRMADYWGCASNNTENIQNNLDTTHENYAGQAANVVASMTQPGLSAENDVAAGTTVAGIEVVAGTDVIHLTGAGGGSSIQIEKPYMNTNSAALHVSVGNGLEQGDLLLVTDCSGGDIFEVTSANPNTSGQVTHNTGTVTLVGNESQNFSKSYGADATVMRPETTSFFIAQGVNGQPSLYMAKDFANPQEMVMGVENMQIFYGEDSDGDKVIERYAVAPASPPVAGDIDLDNVLSVRIQLLIASDDDTVNQDGNDLLFNGNNIEADGRLRKVYTVVANIRNRMDG